MKLPIIRERKELCCGSYEECEQWIEGQRGLRARDGLPDRHYVIEALRPPGPAFAVYHERRKAGVRKAVYRETVGTVKVQGVSKDHHRPLVVGLEVGDVISFRPKGTQQLIQVPIVSLYRFAAFSNARALAAQKRKGKKAKR